MKLTTKQLKQIIREELTLFETEEIQIPDDLIKSANKRAKYFLNLFDTYKSNPEKYKSDVLYSPTRIKTDIRHWISRPKGDIEKWFQAILHNDFSQEDIEYKTIDYFILQANKTPNANNDIIGELNLYKDLLDPGEGLLDLDWDFVKKFKLEYTMKYKENEFNALYDNLYNLADNWRAIIDGLHNSNKEFKATLKNMGPAQVLIMRELGKFAEPKMLDALEKFREAIIYCLNNPEYQDSLGSILISDNVDRVIQGLELVDSLVYAPPNSDEI